MLIRRLLFSVVLPLFLLSSCGDDNPTKPTPVETFELRIAVVDSNGAPVEGLQVSAWNDTLQYDAMATPTFPLSSVGSSFLGDVDCDGDAYSYADAELLKQYLLWGAEYVGDSLDCIQEHGDVVVASEGITVSDYAYLWNRGIGNPVGSASELRPVNASYQYDDSSRDLYVSDAVGWLYIVCEGFDPSWGVIQGDSHWNFSKGHTTADTRIIAKAGSNIGGHVGPLPGNMLMLQGATDWGAPLVFSREPFKTETWMLAPNPGDSQVVIHCEMRYTRPVTIGVYDLSGHRVDSIEIPTFQQYGSAIWSPPVDNTRIYRFVVMVHETDELISVDTATGAIWTDDLLRNRIGMSNSSGSVISTDDLRFPGLSKDTLWEYRNDPQHPLIGTYFTDSVTIHVRDTSTGEFKEQRFLLSHGRNDVTVVWP